MPHHLFLYWLQAGQSLRLKILTGKGAAQTMGLIIHCLFVGLLCQIVKSTFRDIGVSVKEFYIPGDINIAYIDSYYKNSPITKRCDTQILFAHQAAEAVQYIVREVNQDESVLPNISLGMVFLKDCNEVQTAIFQVSKLLPTTSFMRMCCLNKDENTTSTKSSYSVAAAMISFSSGLSIPISRLLSMYKIPHISVAATTDTLSDKTEFEYFSRTACIPIPPTYLHWLDPIALGLMKLSGAGLLTTMAIILIFIKYRKKKVVKGSSVEQMATIIIALLMSDALYTMKHNIICNSSYLIYGIE